MPIGRRGRAIIRLKDEELKKRLEGRYASEEGQIIYSKRKEKVELVFGHIKRNLNGGAFLIRGLAGVRAEWALFASCFIYYSNDHRNRGRIGHSQTIGDRKKPIKENLCRF